MKHGLLYLCVYLLLFACQKTIDVDIPRNPAKLTANALFSPDSLWKVELTQNRYILDTVRFAPVPDAQIRVLQGGSTVAELAYAGEDRFSGNSIYKAKEGRPQTGQAYSLEVTRPGTTNLTSASRVPVPSPIISVVWDTLDIRNDPTFVKSAAYGITIRFADPPETNFYSLSIIGRGYNVYFETINANGDTVNIADRTTGIGGANIKSDDPVIDEPFDRYRNELFFKDVSFNGREYEIKLYVEISTEGTGRVSNLDLYAKESIVLSGIPLYNRNGELINPPGTKIFDKTLYAVLRTTTEEYYRYHYTRDLQAATENNPFAQPVQVFNNIGNGLGIFAGYSQSEKQATFK